MKDQVKEHPFFILNYDPRPKLLSSGDSHLEFQVKRDLLDEGVRDAELSKDAIRIIRKQNADGSWTFKSSSKDKYPSLNRALTETFKSLRMLVGKYELNKSHPAIEKAAEYVFSCQTEEGDIRGMLGNQYMPYYCGMLVEYLVRAGYGDDKRTLRALKWLEDHRQEDGGWVVPIQTMKVNHYDDSTYAAPPHEAAKNLPSSHLVTGMALRAFAFHAKYQSRDAAREAGRLLKSRFFQPDAYGARKAPAYWTKFQYPFWWTTILSSLDTLHRLGFTKDDPDIEKAIEWLLVHQREDGLWNTQYDKGKPQKVKLHRLWVAYAICRILKNYLE